MVTAPALRSQMGSTVSGCEAGAGWGRRLGGFASGARHEGFCMNFSIWQMSTGRRVRGDLRWREWRISGVAQWVRLCGLE